MLEQPEIHEETALNPIDNVEDVLSAQNWTFKRPSNDELIVEVSGKESRYTLFFIWQDNMNALQFGCHYDIEIPKANIEHTRTALASINENLWMGHFDVPKETQTPIFRYTCLLHTAEQSSTTGTIESLVDIALVQCERYHSLFQLLAQSSNELDDQAIELATMEPLGKS